MWDPLLFLTFFALVVKRILVTYVAWIAQVRSYKYFVSVATKSASSSAFSYNNLSIFHLDLFAA